MSVVAGGDASRALLRLQVLLGAGCIALAAVCYSLRATNQKLTMKLARRDAELAELVSCAVLCCAVICRCGGDPGARPLNNRLIWSQ